MPNNELNANLTVWVEYAIAWNTNKTKVTVTKQTQILAQAPRIMMRRLRSSTASMHRARLEPASSMKFSLIINHVL